MERWRAEMESREQKGEKREQRAERAESHRGMKPLAIGLGTPRHWRTILEPDGPNHLDCDAMCFHENQMALITSDCLGTSRRWRSSRL